MDEPVLSGESAFGNRGLDVLSDCFAIFTHCSNNGLCPVAAEIEDYLFPLTMKMGIVHFEFKPIGRALSVSKSV